MVKYPLDFFVSFSSFLSLIYLRQKCFGLPFFPPYLKIACLEEIAYLNGWISKDELMEVYEVMKKNQYGQYLKDVMDGKYQEHLY